MKTTQRKGWYIYSFHFSVFCHLVSFLLCSPACDLKSLSARCLGKFGFEGWRPLAGRVMNEDAQVQPLQNFFFVGTCHL